MCPRRRLGWGGFEPYAVSGHKAFKALEATYTSFHDSILGLPAMDKFVVEGIPHIFGLPDAVFARPAEWPDDYVHITGFWYARHSHERARFARLLRR